MRIPNALFQNFIILLAFALFTFGAYAYFNKPLKEPAWPSIIPGFAFSPYQDGQSPFSQTFPSSDSIDADLALLSGSVHAIRTYSVEGVFGDIPKLAAKYRINLAIGAWLDANLETNEQELARLDQIIHSPPYNIVRVIAGNEALLREELTVEQMGQYLDRLRVSTRLPVSTAEPWHVWIKQPELAQHVDFLAVHMLPYWEGIDVDLAVDYIVHKMNLLKETFPNKPIVIAEVGWPSHGRTIKNARATKANEAVFLRRFIERAQKEGYVYYVMEAFDQPWKSELEGAVGAHWGVYDANRQPKFEFYQPIIPIEEWRILAIASILLSIFLVMFLLLDGKSLKKRGRSFLMAVAFVASSVIIWVVYEHSLSYHNWISNLVGGLLLLGVIGVWVIILIEAHEWAEALWVSQRRRECHLQAVELADAPFVSIHVPAYNEPAAMMIETLNALAQLDYSNYEVLIIDNNTPDEATWRPVEAHCQTLGEKFKFFHVAPLSGYKAGALNFALRHTAEQAEVVAVIDSDYKVKSDWLRQLVGHFTDPKVAIVQAPQDYRDFDDNAFKAMCFAEYKGFFHIGMVTRNDRNAIIQHGTMTMVRRSVLAEVGWGEATITEDAELGLRIFERGHHAVYAETSFGQGLMPDTFLDYKKQRYRWAYGAMQILRQHAGSFFRPKSGLNAGQRYHFIAGWLPWIADGFNFIFTLLAVVWSVLMLIDPVTYNAPHWIISMVPMLFFGFKLLKMLVLYRSRMRASFRTAFAAALSGLALSHTIAQAVLYGLFIGRKMPFLRTPKQASSVAIFQAMRNAAQETLLMLLLLGLLVAIIWRVGLDSSEVWFWCGVLMVQMVPYLSALIVSLMSALPKLSAKWLCFKSV